MAAAARFAGCRATACCAGRCPPFGCPPSLAARLALACPLLSIAARARRAFRSPATGRAPSNCQSPTDSLQPCRPSRPPRSRSRARSRWAAAASVWARWSKAQHLSPHHSCLPTPASPAPPGRPARLFPTRRELGHGRRVVGAGDRLLAAGAVARRLPQAVDALCRARLLPARALRLKRAPFPLCLVP